MYFDRSLSPAARSNYALREEHAAAAPRARPRPDRGQRPGRQPRPGLAAGQGGGADRRPRHRPAARRSRPTGRAGRGCSATWASRRSTSPSATPRCRRRPSGPASSSTPGRSTASSPRAASRPSWAGARTSGTFPSGGLRHADGCGAAIYLNQPGAGTRVRTWTPNYGPVPRLPGHPQRGDLDRRLPDRCATATPCSTGRPCTTPTTPATPPCCRCTSWPAAAGSSRPSSG